MPKVYRKKAPSRSYQASSSNKFGWIVFGILIGLFFAIMVYWKQTNKTRHHEVVTKAPATHNAEIGATKKSTEQPATPANTNTPEFDFYTVLPKMQVNSNHPVKMPATQTQQATATAAAPVTPPAATQPTIPATTQTAAPAAIANTSAATVATPTKSVAATQAPTTSAVSSTATATKQEKTVATTPNETTTETAAATTADKESTTKNATTKIADSKTAENKSVEPKDKDTDSSAHYMLQMAAVKTYADADRLKAQLTMLGFDVYIQSYSVNGQIHNRVVMGPYTSKAAALQQQTQLQKDHVGSILVKVP